MAINPISTTRVTNISSRDRLVQQVQRDQNEIFKLQNQLSTGRRIFLPSDDASATQRALVLQRTIERKEQSLSNLQGTQSALATSELSLAEVADTLNQIRGDSLGAISAPSGSEDRNAVIQLIDQALSSLARIGNSNYAGSSLFSGGVSSVDPYSRVANSYVEYLGGETSPQTFVDVGFLFDTAAIGDSIFGGLSEAIRGQVDLNPQLTPDTRLAQLNGGLGISENAAIQVVFDPTSPTELSTASVIDLSSASTLADVARLIEESAPAGTSLYARVSGQGLTISATGGAIAINEISGGSTAAELGLPAGTSALPTLVGTDLDPVLVKTTEIGDLVGIRSRGRIELPGANNDLTIEAAANGSSFNNLTIDIQGGGSAGSETAVYDNLTNTLTVTIDATETTAAQLASAINAEGTFTAATDYRDAESAAVEGLGGVAIASYTGVTDSAGTNGSIDLGSGLQVVNGDETYTIDTSSVETVEDLLNLLNRPEYGLLAAINESGTGLDVRTRRSGADFSIGENGGTTATDLGIRTFTGDAFLSDFNRGIGVIVEGNANNLNLQVVDDGITNNYEIDLTGVATVSDLINAVNTQTGGEVVASLAATGNGLVFTGSTAATPGLPSVGTVNVGGDTLTFQSAINDPTLDGPQQLIIQDTGVGGLSTTINGNEITVDLGGSGATSDLIAADISLASGFFNVTSSGTAAVSSPQTLDFETDGGAFASAAGAIDSITVSGTVAQQLGFVAEGDTSATSTSGTLASEDRHTYNVDSMFDTLIRLRDAFIDGNIEEAGFEINRIEEDLSRVNFGRAEIGTRMQESRKHPNSTRR